MVKIAVIGAGAYGTALGNILSDKGFLVLYYDPRLPDSDILSTQDGASYTLLAVPSDAVDDVLPSLFNGVPLIVATKGILKKEIFADFDDVMLISGAGFAEDISLNKKTVLTTNDYRVVDLFSTEYLTFDYTNDFSGMLLSGSLKNVYAIGAGILDLKYGSPEWREYIADVYSEFKLILDFNNCDPHTVNLSCGIGDLKLTCDTPSRNYQFGLSLVKEDRPTPAGTIEGLSTAQAIYNGELALPKDAVILKSIVKRVIDGTK